jgi:hypothetical protein
MKGISRHQGVISVGKVQISKAFTVRQAMLRIRTLSILGKKRNSRIHIRIEVQIQEL